MTVDASDLELQQYLFVLHGYLLEPPDVQLSKRQQALLTEPADPHTFVPSLFSDEPA